MNASFIHLFGFFCVLLLAHHHTLALTLSLVLIMYKSLSLGLVECLHAYYVLCLEMMCSFVELYDNHTAMIII